MKRITTTISLLTAIALVACGGGAQEGGTETAADTGAMAPSEAAAPAETGGQMSTPDWMTVDQTSKTVSLDIKAGEADVNNRWNFNGMYAGHGSITVPQGYTVTVNFTNADPTQPHSMAVLETRDTWPATFENPTPVFSGAETPDASTTGTPPNGTATLTFTTDTAGNYTMVCLIAGHAVAGMHVPFNVSSDGSYGATQ